MDATTKERRPAGARIRVLTADASLASRSRIAEALASDQSIEIAGTAANASLALKRAGELEPDAVVVGAAMPGAEQFVRDLRALSPRIRVIPFEADAPGDRGASELVRRIHGLFTFVNSRDAAQSDPGKSPAPRPASRIETRCAIVQRRKVVAIGVSTGGPNALAAIVPMFPADFSLPILVVQHMPASFTSLLAERLDARTPLKVEEAKEGTPVEPGRILIAPGDFHTRVRALPDGRVIATLDQAPVENSCRPSVDALFRSVAEVYGGAAIAVVLTGMGQDGAAGALLLRNRGAYVVAQDEASSVVWGMPRAVVSAGAADAVVDLNAVVPEILKQV